MAKMVLTTLVESALKNQPCIALEMITAPMCCLRISIQRTCGSTKCLCCSITPCGLNSFGWMACGAKSKRSGIWRVLEVQAGTLCSGSMGCMTAWSEKTWWRIFCTIFTSAVKLHTHWLRGKMRTHLHLQWLVRQDRGRGWIGCIMHVATCFSRLSRTYQNRIISTTMTRMRCRKHVSSH